MEKVTAVEVLRRHCIEMDLGDHRSTEQVLAAFIAKGHIQIELEPQEQLSGEGL